MADSEISSDGRPPRLIGLEALSEELELCARARVGVPAAARASKPKKDQRLGVLVGLGVAGEVGLGTGKPANNGVEFRLRGDGEPSPTAIEWTLGVRSNTAPAVLGRESLFLPYAGDPKIAGEGESRSAVVTELDRDIIEEMLPDTEWLGRTVAVLAVSVDTIDNGRGINSSVSENPTLALGTAFVGELLALRDGSTRSTGDSGTFSTAAISGAGSAGLDWSLLVSENGLTFSSKSAGVVGALLPREGLGLLGLSIMVRSWLEMAADRRCLWPGPPGPRRRGFEVSIGARFGEANPPSDLVGLVLITVIESPVLMFPPTNSLPPR